jgi:Flp pilus assembly pilin Flp
MGGNPTMTLEMLKNFVREEEGQDLIEYTLLLAFVALASAALFIGAGTSINTIWTVTNNILSNAAAAAS